MVIVKVNNSDFDLEIGKKLLKIKHTICPIDELRDEWDSIPELKFAEIATIENIESRRVAMDIFGTERLMQQIEKELVCKSVCNKLTKFVHDDGKNYDPSKQEVKEYEDTYELYKVEAKLIRDVVSDGDEDGDDDYFYFVRFKDVSTQREYMIWVDMNSVCKVNEKSVEDVSAIDAIAWTMKVNCLKGQIDKIIRQGDLILVKPIGDNPEPYMKRHLTGEEYLKYLVLES